MRAGISCSSAIVLPEESLHLGDHGARLARLREIPVASHLHRLLTIRRERVGGEGDDRDLSRLRIVLQHLRRFPSVDDGNRDVHQNEVRLFRPRLRNPLLAIQRLGYRVAEMPQDGGIDDAVVFVVFNQQYRLAVRGHESPHTSALAGAMEWERSGVVWLGTKGSAAKRWNLTACSQVSYHLHGSAPDVLRWKRSPYTPRREHLCRERLDPHRAPPRGAQPRSRALDHRSRHHRLPTGQVPHS